MAFGIVDFPFPFLQCVCSDCGRLCALSGKTAQTLYMCRSSAARVLGRLLAAPSCGVLVGGRGDDGALFFSQVLAPRGSVRAFSHGRRHCCRLLSPCTEDASCECLVNRGLWHGGPSLTFSRFFFFFPRDIAAVKIVCVCGCAFLCVQVCVVAM